MKDLIDSSKRQRILAVHESDLATLLTRLGVMDQVDQGHFKCASCGLTISLANIGIVSKKDGKIQISCNMPTCQATLKTGTAK